MIRKDNGSNNTLFLSCQMGLSDGIFFMIKHTPLPNGNHPISSPLCPMGVADTLEQQQTSHVEINPANCGCFHIFLAQLFPVILQNIYYRKLNEKTWPTWHLSVIPGPAFRRSIRAASRAQNV